jgi:hypothetical protein
MVQMPARGARFALPNPAATDYPGAMTVGGTHA